MKKVFTILTVAVLVVACGGGNTKKEEPKSIEGQLSEYITKMETAVNEVKDYEKAMAIYSDYDQWQASLDEKQKEELDKAYDKNVERLSILGAIVDMINYGYDDMGEGEGDDVEEVYMVYSNAFDGYLNVRAKPSTKSQVLSVLRNGPEGAELLDVEGKWTKVRINGVEGYVWTADTQSYPSDPVYISSASVIGEWIWVDEGAHINNCSIKSNGKFEMQGWAAGYTSGKWRLSGNNLILINDEGGQTVCGVTHKTIIINGNEFERNDY